ncbi:uncharacterized protein [Dendropsophus ebraccatus]|uniref:uncharacterized protein n=1 Tax=Dendropsophus ebraccatus TaxID=150705 RepID=UPI0038320966
MPDVPLGPGRERMRPLLRAALSEATWSSHGKAWAEWLGCAAGQVWLTQEVCNATTWAFLEKLRVQGASAAVAKKRLAGVSFMLRLWGLPDVTKDLALQLVLRGWKKEVVKRDARRAISFILLQQLLGSLSGLCSSPYEIRLFHAAFSLAFFGALRVGELVAASRSAPPGLRIADVVVLSDSLRIFIRKSKTDIYANGAWLSVFSLQGPYCPVGIVRQYKQSLPLSASSAPSSHFLVHEDKSPLTKFQFVSMLKKCLFVAGLNPTEFGTHSFRIGAATVADSLGMPGESVKRIGRWASDCYKRYVRPNLLCY